MAQYCRYCDYAFKGPWVCHCLYSGDVHLTRTQVKHTNNCKHFKLNPVDVLRENPKGYRPNGKKIVQHGGLGKQVKMEEIFNV